MAGTYPDVPTARIPYDKDGSVGISISSTNQATILTPAQLASINNESTANSITIPNAGSIVIMFAEPMTISGSFHTHQYSQYGLTTYTSADTSNGVDGTWSTFRSNAGNSTLTPNYRTNIFASGSPVSNVKAIKLGISSISQSFYCLHLYGTPSVYDGDKLVFWHPTLDQPLAATPAYFDYGDTPQNAPAIERNFRLKNISTTLNANSVTVSCEAPTDSSPTTYVSQTAFRYNGGSYGATASMATLGPNEISPVFTAKLQVAPTANLSLWVQRYIAEAANWS